MSLRSQAIYCVPEETARIARAIFPSGNLVMRMYDELDMLFHDADFADLFPANGQPAAAPIRDADFADLFPANGQPAAAPIRLARITLLQFWEGLTDRQAADASRTRIDWKYLLCLELTDTGFDHSVFSEFRTRLLDHGAERRLFDAILVLAQSRNILKAGGRQRNDSTHVLGAMRALTRLEHVTETVRYTLNMLATIAPDWLRVHTTPAWVDRYGLRASEYRLPKGDAKRREWAGQIGADGSTLLTAAYAPTAPAYLRTLPAVELLRHVWMQNFTIMNDKLVWRENDNTPPAGLYIGSPYDRDARYATKRHMHWSGYKIHLTEAYGDHQPNVITNVETTHAAVADDAVTETIHVSLADHHLLPEKHVADTGYVNSTLLVSSQRDYSIDLIGPTRTDTHWQAKEGTGFTASDFTIDWEQQQAHCPAGSISNSWTPAIDRFKNHVIKIKFATKDCKAWTCRAQCTRSTPPRRTITIRPQAQNSALQAGRKREQTAEFKREYAKRAGIEGTIAQSVRTGEVRRARYFGQAKTHLQHLMTAAIMNVIRILQWLGEEAKAQTRQSAFTKLYYTTT